MQWPTQELDAIATTAQLAALEAGSLLRQKWSRPPLVSRKGFRDLVTDADLAVQECIRQIVSERHPTHSFLGEEGGAGPAGSRSTAGETVWIVDPVDGTSNYSRQLPIFSISIGVAQRDRIIAGVIYDPLREELFRAVVGRGAFCGERRLTVSNIAEPAEAILALDWGHERRIRERSVTLLGQFAQQVHTIRALGSAALALAWVATGRLDAYLNVDLKPWDVAAGSLIVEEAGGSISRLDGQPCNWSEPSISCLASNSLLHLPLLQIAAA